jgi:hypothetical protein
MKNDHDHTMYYNIKNGGILILLLYVDDSMLNTFLPIHN